VDQKVRVNQKVRLNQKVHKGSIAVDGISLTIADLGGDRFDVQIVPYTMQHTNLGRAKARDQVNLECDMVGKYVARAVELAGLNLTGVRTGEVTH
jgi:riboflavin synthase alpha subunit